MNVVLPIIIGIVSGGTLTAIITHFLTRKRFNLDLEMHRAKTEAEIEAMKSTDAYQRLEGDTLVIQNLKEEVSRLIESTALLKAEIHEQSLELHEQSVKIDEQNKVIRTLNTTVEALRSEVHRLGGNPDQIVLPI